VPTVISLRLERRRHTRVGSGPVVQSRLGQVVADVELRVEEQDFDGLLWPAVVRARRVLGCL
jgi:hypothetical protein